MSEADRCSLEHLSHYASPYPTGYPALCSSSPSKAMALVLFQNPMYKEACARAIVPSLVKCVQEVSQICTVDFDRPAGRVLRARKLDALSRLSLRPTQPQVLFVKSSFTVTEIEVIPRAMLVTGHVVLAQGPPTHGFGLGPRVVDHVRELASTSIDEPVGNLVCKSNS